VKPSATAVTTIDEYIQGFPPNVRALLSELRSTIRRAAPEAVEKISYGIPTFDLNGNLVHFAAFERHIGFYPGPSGIAAFQTELRKYKSAKGSVQFPLDEPLPLELVAAIVKFPGRGELPKEAEGAATLGPCEASSTRLTLRNAMSTIRPCGPDEHAAILAIVNAAAEAYRGVIPSDCWHEPYMPPEELEREIAAGVTFWGYEADGDLIGVMGIQRVRDVDLIRHAYVLPGSQGRGVGSRLLAHLQSLTTRRILIGTWMDAEWAIRFYRRHGYELVSPAEKASLLKTYWTISERQIETSVVLANPPLRPT
jgi:uncharacterized protein YdhG (YjbR/CyaY superfamily)/GNAT superfamily N-acetyltransferase